MKKKVFCNNCKCLSVAGKDFECHSEHNTEKIAKYNWLVEEIISVKYLDHPSVINKNNNCGYYCEIT